MMTNTNYYEVETFNVDHSTFGMNIYKGDFDGWNSMSNIAERIISDWKFDQQCKRNAENRDRSKQFKQQEGAV